MNPVSVVLSLWPKWKSDSVVRASPIHENCCSFCSCCLLLFMMLYGIHAVTHEEDLGFRLQSHYLAPFISQLRFLFPIRRENPKERVLSLSLSYVREGGSENWMRELNTQRSGYTSLESMLTMLVATSTTSLLHVRAETWAIFWNI